MTLREVFTYLGQHPSLVLFYYWAVPMLALLAGILGKNEGELTPWNYLYTFLIYIVSIPGIFAVGFNIYYFLIQRGDIMETDVFVQVFPLVVMFVTIWLIRRNVELEKIPGFKTISGLWIMLFATMALMYILDKTHIVVFSYLPFQYLLLLFLLLFALIYFGWRKVNGK